VAPVVAVRAASPDGKIVIGVNDHNVFLYAMPAPLLGEGQWYSPGYGTRMFVLRFVPGVEYGQLYARNFLLRGASFTLREKRDRPDLVRFQNQLNAQYAATGAQVQATAGETSFETMIEGRPAAGYVLASTEMVAMMGTGIWNVKSLYFFLAPPEEAPRASALLGEMLRSVQVNPQWFYANLKMTGDVSKIVTETNAYVSKLQSESYWNRQRAQDRANQNFSDYMRGVQRVRDPNTGEVYEARAGHNYYYRARGEARPFGVNQTGIERVLDVTELEKID
jgi:hypothetical protein